MDQNGASYVRLADLNMEAPLNHLRMLVSRHKRTVGLTALGLLLGAGLAQAQDMKVGRLNPPASVYTTASGLNNRGTIVGSFGAPGKQLQGFRYSIGKKAYKAINYPGATYTIAMAVNDNNVIVGEYSDSGGLNHGYFLQGSTFTQYDVDKTGTGIFGINNAGDFVGSVGANGNYQGFLNVGGKVTTFTVDGNPTEAYGINSADSVVGYFVDPQFTGTHGFVRDASGKVTQIDPPGSNTAGCTGITDSGVITGFYEDGSGAVHGFILANGKYRKTGFQYVARMNQAGAFVGSVIGKDGLTYGFEAHPTR